MPCRYSAYIGGTNEWTGMTGLTLNTQTKTLYMSVTSVTNSMNNVKFGTIPNVMRVPANECGCGMLPHWRRGDTYSTILP